jgi:hypothetical protein
MKLKKMIDGKEVEIEFSQAEALQALEIDNKNVSGDGVIGKIREMLNLETESKPSKKSKESDLSPVINELQESVKILANALNEEKNARKVATDTLQKQAQDLRSKEIKSIVSDAIKSGKIVPADETKWSARLEKDFDTSKDVLGEIPASKAIGAKGVEYKGEGEKKEAPGTYTVEDYLSNPGKYSEIAKSEFSTEAK